MSTEEQIICPRNKKKATKNLLLLCWNKVILLKVMLIDMGIYFPESLKMSYVCGIVCGVGLLLLRV